VFFFQVSPTTFSHAGRKRKSSRTLYVQTHFPPSERLKITAAGLRRKKATAITAEFFDLMCILAVLLEKDNATNGRQGCDAFPLALPIIDISLKRMKVPTMPQYIHRVFFLCTRM